MERRIKHECHMCGKQVTSYINRKRNQRHKCPHGNWCDTGRADIIGKYNNTSGCEECRKWQIKRDYKKSGFIG